jgi:hypothetical protein
MPTINQVTMLRLSALIATPRLSFCVIIVSGHSLIVRILPFRGIPVLVSARSYVQTGLSLFVLMAKEVLR